MVLPDRSSDITVGVGRGLSAAAEYWPGQVSIAAAGAARTAARDRPTASSKRYPLISLPPPFCHRRQNDRGTNGNTHSGPRLISYEALAKWRTEPTFGGSAQDRGRAELSLSIATTAM